MNAFGRTRGWLRRRVTTMRLAMLVVALICLIVVGPVILLAIMSFWSSQFLQQSGHLTLANYARFLTAPGTGNVILTTLLITVGSTAFALVVGGALAWFVARTSVPFKSVLKWLPVGPLVLTGLLRDTAWVGLYSPTTGIVNRWWESTFKTSSPLFNIYGLAGLILTMGLAFAPIPYLTMLNPMTNIDRSLEEASRTSGANQRYTILRITLPLLRPAILSGLTLTAMVAAGSFEAPIIIGLPGGVHTFVSEIYTSMTSSLDYSLAAAQSMIYLAAILLLLVWYLRSTRTEVKFATVGGRGLSSPTTSRSKMRYLLMLPALSYFLIAFLQPLGAAVYLSLVPYYTATGKTAPMTLNNYRHVFAVDQAWLTILNSLKVAALAAVLCVAAALLISYVAFKTRVRGRRTAELAGTLPIAMPPVLFGAAILITFLSVPGISRLYNSIYILLIAEVVVFLPYALRVTSSAIINIDNQLLEASSTSGAKLLRTVRSVVVPLLGPALGSAAAVVFVLSFRELGAVVLVVPPNLTLVPTAIFSDFQAGEYGAVNAFNVVALAATIVALLLAWAVTVIAGVALRSWSRRAATRRAGIDDWPPSAGAMSSRSPQAVGALESERSELA